MANTAQPTKATRTHPPPRGKVTSLTSALNAVSKTSGHNLTPHMSAAPAKAKMQLHSLCKEKTKATGMSTEKVKVILLTCHQKLPPSDGNALYVIDVTTQKIIANVSMKKAIAKAKAKECIKLNPTARKQLQNHNNGSKEPSVTLCLNVTCLTRMDAFMTPIVAITDMFAR